MKAKDLKPGMEVMLGAPSLNPWTLRRAVVIGVGWTENRFGHFRAVSERGAKFYPDGGKGVAVAVCRIDEWLPDVVTLGQIRGPYEAVKAEIANRDKVERAYRLKQAEIGEHLHERRDALEERIQRALGDDSPVSLQLIGADRVSVKLDMIEELLTLIEQAVDVSVPG